MMSRPIKFRAWDKTSDVMRTDISSIDYDSKGNICQINVITGADILFPDKEAVLMQYTGLKDCNGKDIYEGDILNFTYWWFDGNEAEMPLTGEVVYVPEEASYGLAHIRSKEWLRYIGAQDTDEDTATFSGWQFSSDDIEVIGNVYEHHELLEANQ